jgi:hypothetical protein
MLLAGCVGAVVCAKAANGAAKSATTATVRARERFYI